MNAFDACSILIRNFVRSNDDTERHHIYDEVYKYSNYRLPLTCNRNRTLAECQEIIIRVTDEWKKNECQWKAFISEQDRELGCSGKKALSGLISYYDDTSGLQISSDDYEAKYSAYATKCRDKNRQDQFLSIKEHSVKYIDDYTGVFKDSTSGSTSSSSSSSSVGSNTNQMLKSALKKHHLVDSDVDDENVGTCNSTASTTSSVMESSVSIDITITNNVEVKRKKA